MACAKFTTCPRITILQWSIIRFPEILPTPHLPLVRPQPEHMLRRYRKLLPEAERPYRVIGYPITPAVFIIAALLLVVNTVFSKPADAGVGLALILSGLPAYAYWRTRAKPTSAVE